VPCVAGSRRFVPRLGNCLPYGDDGRGRGALARDLLNSDYAGHRLTFVQFAQAPHFNHLKAVYNAFDFSGPLDFVKRAAGLSDRVAG
jgi:4-hydroxyphenylacetate 3-monooxygenase